MRQKPKGSKVAVEATVRDIRRRTRKQYSAEEKIRIVLAGLRGEDSIAELCRQEGIAESLYYSWSKEFLEDRSYSEIQAPIPSQGASCRQPDDTLNDVVSAHAAWHFHLE